MSGGNEGNAFAKKMVNTKRKSVEFVNSSKEELNGLLREGTFKAVRKDEVRKICGNLDHDILTR